MGIYHSVDVTLLGSIVITFVFGSIIGFLFQRSRFCNASALRDAILFKSFRNTKPMLVGMMVTTFIFTLWVTVGQGNMINLKAGLYTVIGLFLFGIGMILAGACTVTTWVKAGEGNLGAWWALLFTFIGMFLYSLIWNEIRWPMEEIMLTNTPKWDALHFGYGNAQTLQEQTGIPAIFFGLLQIGALGFIYKKILDHEKKAGSAN
ncbi:MAG: YeeE/YedE thiosulfate transporter family protein [Desulfurivibrionaceae bacterium]